jgi:hypothetical protein
MLITTQAPPIKYTTVYTSSHRTGRSGRLQLYWLYQLNLPKQRGCNHTFRYAMQKVTAVSPSNFVSVNKKAAIPNIWDTAGPSYTIGFCQLRFPYHVAGRCDFRTLLHFSTQTLQQVAETAHLGGVTTLLSSIFQLRPSNK